MADIDTITDHRIRERAFALWQEAGCPEGRAEEFWHRARDAETNESTDLVEKSAAHYPPAGDTQNFA